MQQLPETFIKYSAPIKALLSKLSGNVFWKEPTISDSRASWLHRDLKSLLLTKVVYERSHDIKEVLLHYIIHNSLKSKSKLMHSTLDSTDLVDLTKGNYKASGDTGEPLLTYGTLPNNIARSLVIHFCRTKSSNFQVISNINCWCIFMNWYHRIVEFHFCDRRYYANSQIRPFR